MPTLKEGTTDEYEGGSGLRKELFDQGLTIEQINSILGTVSDPDSVVGKLAAISTAVNSTAKASDLSSLATIVGSEATTEKPATGLVGAVAQLSSDLTTNTAKYESLLDDYNALVNSVPANINAAVGQPARDRW